MSKLKERELKFWRLAAVISVVLAGIAVSTRSVEPTRIEGKAVVAREFDLVNASGRVTARLASDPSNPDSPNFVLKYPNDKPAILIGIDSSTGSSVSLLNSKGQPRATVSVNADGPGLAMFDEGDKLRLVVTAMHQQPQIVVYDPTLKKVWTVPAIK